MAITEYKVIDYIRALKKLKNPSDLNLISSFLAGVNSDADLRIDIDKAFNKLNHKEKTVLNLLKVEGQSISEVAKQLNLSEGNVKVIAHRAYINLKVLLGVHS